MELERVRTPRKLKKKFKPLCKPNKQRVETFKIQGGYRKYNSFRTYVTQVKFTAKELKF